MPTVNSKDLKSLKLEVKLKILRGMENGGKGTIVSRDFGLLELTVRTIVKNREKIKYSGECLSILSATTLVQGPQSWQKNEMACKYYYYYYI